jgi:DNA-binding IclR family transcriptional regulator
MNNDAPTDVQRDGTQSIRRAATVLRAVAVGQASGRGLEEISRVTGLRRPTVHRILGALVSEGLIEQHPRTRRYLIGEQVPMLALARAKRPALLDASEAYVEKVAHEIGDATFLTIRTKDDTLCLARRLGSFPIQVLAIEVGARRPLGVSAAGISILAAMPSDEANEIVRRNEHRFAAHKMTLPIVEQRIAEARALGYAISDPGIVLGTKALGVSIKDPLGRSLGALTVAATRQRLRPQREIEISEILFSHSKRIGAQMGYPARRD